MDLSSLSRRHLAIAGLLLILIGVVVYLVIPSGPEFGTVKWTYDTGSKIASTPAVTGDLICIGSEDGFLHAVNGRSGQGAWKCKAVARVGFSPCVQESWVYFAASGPGGGAVQAADARTGELKWSFRPRRNPDVAADVEIRGDAPSTAPVVADGVVYFGSDNGYVYAVDPRYAGGRAKWEFKASSLAVVSRPAVADGVVYFGCVERATRGLFALDAETGGRKWHFPTQGPVSAGPVVVGQTVCFGCGDHVVYGLDAAGGREKWRLETGGPIKITPAVADGRVYCGSNDRHLYAIDAKTGRRLWQFATIGPVSSTPTLRGDRVYFTTAYGRLYVLDADDGEELWRFKLTSQISSSPAVIGDTVYFGCFDGKLYAVQGPD